MNKVLLVEDHPLQRKSASLLLSRIPCTVVEASSGEAALALAQQDKFDLILMDLGLPGIDGIETTQQIRSSENKNQQTPIVALTANTDEAMEQKSLAAGMNAFLSKPLNLEKLKQWLDGSE
jgi:CheY-like chemotaxis protein